MAPGLLMSVQDCMNFTKMVETIRERRRLEGIRAGIKRMKYLCSIEISRALTYLIVFMRQGGLIFIRLLPNIL